MVKFLLGSLYKVQPKGPNRQDIGAPECWKLMRKGYSPNMGLGNWTVELCEVESDVKKGPSR